MKIKIKALVQSVSEKKTTEKQTQYVNILVMVPGYADEWGTKIGEDEHYEINAFGKQLDMVPVELIGNEVDPSKGQLKVVLDCYLNSRKKETDDKKVFYNLSLSLAKWETIN